MADTKLGGACPQDGREWDAQCGRCGSSIDWVDCELCGGEGYSEHDCGDDTCCCLEPENNLACASCGGAGGFNTCLSSREWCDDHPLEGRERVGSATPEWFCIGGVREVAHG